jgi:hypothetical protein
MSVVSSNTAPVDEAGRAVLEAAVAAATALFGPRLIAAYALGSLSHGGFTPLVSDVDLALLLDRPDPADASAVDQLTSQVRATGLPLAGRLSVFWDPEGRLPAADRLDLLRSGVLLAGTDRRDRLVEPSLDELIRGGAEFAVDVLGRPDRLAEITDARATADAGPRTASKVALFPVRFLYTSRAGRIGPVAPAIEHYLARAGIGPRRDLVAAAAGWRTGWDPGEPDRAAGLLAAGLVPLYDEFVEEYATRLGPGPLADALRRWSPKRTAAPAGDGWGNVTGGQRRLGTN